MENNTNTEELTADAKLIQAKALLEYFVSHLEWEVNNDPSFVGYEKYIAPNVVDAPGNPGHKKLPDGMRRGNGEHGDRLQQWIKNWELFGAPENNDVVCLHVVSHGAPNEKPKGCYLQWKGTGANIKAEWNQNHVDKLYLCIYWDKDLPSVMEYTVDELGLFDGQAPNENLKTLWHRFEDLRWEWWDMDTKWWAEHGNQKTENEDNVVAIVDELQKLISNNKNLILTGAPGTGKTYLAKQLACKLVGAQSTDDDQYKNHVKFVQFHPSYDYTDFVEGLRPKDKDDGQLGFERKDGTFKKLCISALNAQEQAQKDGVEAPAFVMIIDEINRGQVSKIFGELFFALDPDYRGEKGQVETQYQNMVPDGDKFKPGFYVPENVYVIGTMNDIDHSLEPLDFAFRRRFAWREITAKERFDDMFKGDEPFKSADDFVAKVKLYFDRLNTAIGKNSGLGAEYQVGPAYFLKLKNFIKGISDLNAANEDQVKGWMEKLWESHLKPLLVEYLKGNSDTSLDIEKLHNAYLNTKPNEGTNQSGEQAGGAQG